MSNNLSHVLRVVTCVFALAFCATAHASDQLERIQRAVAELKGQLAISQTVDVKIVQTNPRLFSVEPVAHAGTFLLSAEEDFAQALTDAELRAAVAHELGHVWIYTHFPYLQTEELANDIASRAVSRDMLAPLYDKVWKKADVTRRDDP
jgi:predicted Zn-dependent protease